jgi:uracil phosphoribosyltransferase
MILETLVNQLRPVDLSIEEFRRVTRVLARALASRAGELLPTEDVEIQTPLKTMHGAQLAGDVLLVPVLRAGLSLLEPFLEYFPKAAVGFVGLKRDETTAVARCYLCNLPPVSEQTHAFILEPMLATGGSASKAIQILLDHGIKEDRISVVSVVSAPLGVERLKSVYPDVRVLVAVQDTELSEQFYIVPGLGDFGDRYYGTPPEAGLGRAHKSGS